MTYRRKTAHRDPAAEPHIGTASGARRRRGSPLLLAADRRRGFPGPASTPTDPTPRSTPVPTPAHPTPRAIRVRRSPR